MLNISDAKKLEIKSELYRILEMNGGEYGIVLLIGETDTMHPEVILLTNLDGDGANHMMADFSAQSDGIPFLNILEQ